MGYELQERASEGGLAAARLSHEAESLATIDVERDVVYGLEFLRNFTEEGFLQGKAYVPVADSE